MGKKEIKKQKASKGEGRARSWAKAGRVFLGQESTFPEKQELHQSSRWERCSQGVGAGSQEGRGCPQAPWDTNRHLHPGESPTTRAQAP